jgi:hypothetical protein
MIFIISKRLQNADVLSCFLFVSFFPKSHYISRGPPGYLFSLEITKAVSLLSWQGRGDGREIQKLAY